MENSWSMQSGMAPPQGLEPEALRSKRKVSIPPEDSASAAHAPAGPPPMTAARSVRGPEMGTLEGGGELEGVERWEEMDGRKQETLRDGVAIDVMVKASCFSVCVCVF